MSNAPDHSAPADHALIHEIRRIDRPEIKNENVSRLPDATPVRKPEPVARVNKFPPL